MNVGDTIEWDYMHRLKLQPHLEGHVPNPWRRCHGQSTVIAKERVGSKDCARVTDTNGNEFHVPTKYCTVVQTAESEK